MEFTAEVLDKINSMTKYPSIPTYHVLGEKGRLVPDLNAYFQGEEVFVTEKIDGTNSRIVILPGGDYFIGSREELLTAKGDRISNPSQGIVEALRQTAKDIAKTFEYMHLDSGVYVLYFETYGGKIGRTAKQYSGHREVSFRLFDIAKIFGWQKILEQDKSEIAAWRENEGPTWKPVGAFKQWANAYGLNTVPYLQTIDVETKIDEPLPLDIEGTYHWLREVLPETRAAIDADGKGQPEGVVVRNASRSRIAKIRFEDYQLTLKVK